MGIFTKLSTLIKSNINDLIARAENPEKMLNQIILDMRDQLAKAKHLSSLGEMVAGVSHEIRNPLNAIKTSAYYLLNAKNSSPEKVMEHLERIDRQVNLADNVISALSKFAKMPFGVSMVSPVSPGPNVAVPSNDPEASSSPF